VKFLLRTHLEKIPSLTLISTGFFRAVNPGRNPENSDMKKKAGYLPDPFEEDDDADFRRTRRYYRKKQVRQKPKRWRKRLS
jgi:hypothetical protein